MRSRPRSRWRCAHDPRAAGGRSRGRAHRFSPAAAGPRASISVVGEADSGESACQLYRRARPRRRGHGPRHAGHGRARGAAPHPRPSSRRRACWRSRRTMTRCMRGARCARARAAFSPSAAPRRRCSKRSPRWPRAALPRRGSSRRSSRSIEVEGGKSPVERLSEREFEVFVRLAGGHTVQRIAEDLKLSASTVGTHLYNIKQKLGVSEPVRAHADRDPPRPDRGVTGQRPHRTRPQSRLARLPRVARDRGPTATRRVRRSSERRAAALAMCLHHSGSRCSRLAAEPLAVAGPQDAIILRPQHLYRAAGKL